ncbi:MAG: hypothetical protein WCW67_02350 [Candidatus Margulisiibacteriota bacterium]|jgi:hypothetical protein
MKKIFVPLLLLLLMGSAHAVELNLGKVFLDLSPAPYGTVEVRWGEDLVLPPAIALIDNAPFLTIKWEIRNSLSASIPPKPRLELFDFSQWHWVDSSIDKLANLTLNYDRVNETDLIGGWKFDGLRGYALTKYRITVLAGSSTEAAREFYISMIPPKQSKFPVFAENAPLWIAGRYEKALLYKWLGLLWRDILTSTYDERIIGELDQAIASGGLARNSAEIKRYVEDGGYPALSIYFSPTYVNLSADPQMIGLGGKVFKAFDKENQVKSLLMEVRDILRKNSVNAHLVNAAKASSFTDRKNLADRLEAVAQAMRDEAIEFSVLAYSAQDVLPTNWRTQLNAEYKALGDLLSEIVNAQERADLYLTNITQISDVKACDQSISRLVLSQLLSAIEDLARADWLMLSLGYETK